MKWIFHKSIKFEVAAALLVQLLVFGGVVATTRYELDLRKHDYAILNLTSQLQVISEAMIAQSSNYVHEPARDYNTYERDLKLFNKDLQDFISRYDLIISSFKDRKLFPYLTDNKEPLYHDWDKPSRDQLMKTAEIWDKYRQGLREELGRDIDGPRLEAAAKYILKNSDILLTASISLSAAIRSMMEEKIADIVGLNRLAIILVLVISSIILAVLYLKVFNPLDRTVRGFGRVSRGDLDYRIPVSGNNEVGKMTEAFNDLSLRLAALFRLTDRINQATNLNDTIKFVFHEFSKFLPIDWVCLLRTMPDQDRFVIDRIYSKRKVNLHERDRFSIRNSLFSQAVERNTPLAVSLAGDPGTYQDDGFVTGLINNGLSEIIVLPLATNSVDSAVLVFATSSIGVYQQEHIELLSNIGAQVSHGFEKTLGMESLVISAVEGLARLAESRDPETGDHLVRMSLYSAIVAEQLGEDSRYQDIVTNAYVRNVYLFAPMHDIGKVGIEDSILLKSGKLSDKERREMERHPVIGGQVLRRCESQVNKVGHSIFNPGIEIAEGHHEKFDGSGYPLKLKGEDIPLSARIVAVADVFDALTSKRPYKEAWSVDKALELMHEQAGKHFDPEVIQAMDKALPKIMKIYDELKHV
ncbi:MAG: hypothetical protein BMS9Abin26_1658 [Gammaproteobacteria bacterium]|nr:MAG: hypothetical protein BMS9Abin26_1658 [Gammaproteobacteria bacterium]